MNQKNFPVSIIKDKRETLKQFTSEKLHHPLDLKESS